MPVWLEQFSLEDVLLHAFASRILYEIGRPVRTWVFPGLGDDRASRHASGDRTPRLGDPDHLGHARLL